MAPPAPPTLLVVLAAVAAVSLAVTDARAENAQQPATVAARWVDEGDVLGGWTVVEVEVHAEFQRITAAAADGTTTGVEVTAGDIADGSSRSPVVQPAPGRTPPAELLEAVRERVAARMEAGRGPPVPRGVRTHGRSDSLPRDPPSFWGTSAAIPFGIPLFSVMTVLAALWLIAIAFFGSRSTARLLTREWDEAAHPWRHFAYAAAAGVAGFGLLRWLVPEVAVNQDTFRDLGIALDCTNGMVCRAGPSAGQAGLTQGTLWPRVLAMFGPLGLDTRALPTALAALDGLAAAWIMWWCRARSGSTLAAVALLACWLVSIVHGEALTSVWNPSLTPLTGAAFAVLAHHALRTGEVDDQVPAAVALVALFESHIAALALTAPWLLAVAVTARRPTRATAVAAATTAATHWLLSPNTATFNLVALFGSGLLLPVLGATAAGIAAVVAIRRRWTVGPGPAIAFIVGSYMLATAVAAAMLGLVPAPRYITPIAALGVGCGAVAFGVWVRAGRRTLVIAAAVIALASSAASPRPEPVPPTEMTLACVPLVLEALDPTLDHLDLRVAAHSTTPRAVAAMVSALRPTVPVNDEPTLEVTLLAGTNPAPPATVPWEVVSCGERHVLVRAYAPRVSRRDAVVCGQSDEGALQCAELCDVRYRAPVPSAETSPRMDEGTILAVEDTGWTPSRFEFRIRPDDGDAARRLRLLPVEGGACNPRIVAVEGVRHAGALPGLVVDLVGRDGGTLIIETDADCRVYGATLPAWVEYSPSETWVPEYAPAPDPVARASRRPF